MIRDKRKTFCYLYVVFVIVLFLVLGNISVDQLYAGVEVGGSELSYMLYFMLFFTRVCFVMGDCERYIQSYAVNEVVRTKSRKIIWKNCVVSAVRSTLIFYLWIFICALICSVVYLPGTILLHERMLVEMAVFYGVDLLLLLLQLFMEILTDSRVAMIVVGCFYISSLIAGDGLFHLGIPKKIYWILFPNIGMYKRIIGDLSVYEVLVFLAVVYVVLYLLGRHMIRRKDIL